MQLHAQCRNFVRNNCGEMMNGYVISENFNAAKLMPGDEAELKLTFSKGEDYRVAVCSHSVLGDVHWHISSDDAVSLFDNEQHDGTNYFDFRVPGTQELTIDVKVSPDNPRPVKPSACVAILIGKKVEL